MGVWVHYWAIPPNSRLYERLQEDLAFNILMARLFPYGCGIYSFSEIEAEEAQEILDGVIEGFREVLGPDQEARRHIDEFLGELERTRIEFPGIERRTAMLEKCSSEVEERLTMAIQNAQPAEWTSKVMYGDQPLAAHLGHKEDTLGLISLPVVLAGAATLERLTPEALFPSEKETRFRDNYEQWREVYSTRRGTAS